MQVKRSVANVDAFWPNLTPSVVEALPGYRFVRTLRLVRSGVV